MKLTFPGICSYIGGIFLVAVGVNISKMAGLGISPVASVPYAVELIWNIELGKATALVYLLLILFQLVLLRKFSLLPFLQLLTTFIMSICTTITSARYLLWWLPGTANYMHALCYLCISILIIGIGVYFYIKPEYIPIPSEGVAKSLTKASKEKLEFHNAKVVTDCGLVVISVILTLAAKGRIMAVREGTIITALLVGKIVGLCKKTEQRIKAHKN